MSEWDSELHLITEIELDEETVIRRSPEVEHERAVALYDIKARNRFRVIGEGLDGPYKLRLSIEDHKRLVFHVTSATGGTVKDIMLAMSPFRRLIRDYFQICESYFDAIKKLSPTQIETIDMARRGLHNEGADLLKERLEDKISMDTATTRRMFTLICVLHIRG